MRTKKLDQNIIDGLKNIIPAERLLLEQPMSLHTTFHIGGPAECMVLPVTIDEVVAVMDLARAHNTPVFVMGGGSNLLVRDAGVAGIVMRFSPECFGRIERTADGLRACAGAMLRDVCAFAAAHALTGVEFACGIPGSIGGAVFMNAGAYSGEMSDCVVRVTVLDKGGAVRLVDVSEAEFSYRNSAFQHDGAVILAAELKLDQSTQDAVTARMTDLDEQRNSKQPMQSYSAGSTFKRPPGKFVGPMIEEAGLKGYSHGGAQISSKHAGFVINTGTATAKDVMELIGQVQKKIKQQFSVDLLTEIRIIGE